MRYLLKYFVLIICLLFCCKAEATITVALIAPKTGDYEPQGAELAKGVQRAVDEINEEGGLLGKKISLMVIDDQCNDSIAISTAQMLSIMKDQKINLVIGPYCANSFDKVADIYATAQIFQIIPTAVNYSQAKTIKKGLVKMLGYTNQQAKDFFEYYNTTFAGDKVAVIFNPEEEESVDEGNAIESEFRKHGKSIVLNTYSYDITANDYDDLAQKVFADDNNLAFLLGTSKNIRKMAYALKDIDSAFKIFANKYTASKEYFEYLGKLANGTYLMELRGKEDDPEFAETLVKLRLSGFDANGLSLYGYSAVKLWENLVKKTKSFKYNSLSNAINNKEVATDSGEKMFHNGTPETSEGYAIYIYEDGIPSRVY